MHFQLPPISLKTNLHENRFFAARRTSANKNGTHNVKKRTEKLTREEVS